MFDDFINHEIDGKAVIIPEDMFFDLKGGRSEEVKFDENAIQIMRKRISEKYGVKEDAWSNVKGTYSIAVNSAAGASNYTLEIKAGAAFHMQMLST
jgi:hypothetical protein